MMPPLQRVTSGHRMTTDQTSAPSIRYRWTVLVMLTLVYTFNFIAVSYTHLTLPTKRIV